MNFKNSKFGGSLVPLVTSLVGPTGAGGVPALQGFLSPWISEEQTDIRPPAPSLLVPVNHAVETQTPSELGVFSPVSELNLFMRSGVTTVLTASQSYTRGNSFPSYSPLLAAPRASAREESNVDRVKITSRPCTHRRQNHPANYREDFTSVLTRRTGKYSKGGKAGNSKLIYILILSLIKAET